MSNNHFRFGVAVERRVYIGQPTTNAYCGRPRRSSSYDEHRSIAPPPAPEPEPEPDVYNLDDLVAIMRTSRDVILRFDDSQLAQIFDELRVTTSAKFVIQDEINQLRYDAQEEAAAREREAEEKAAEQAAEEAGTQDDTERWRQNIVFEISGRSGPRAARAFVGSYVRMNPYNGAHKYVHIDDRERLLKRNPSLHDAPARTVLYKRGKRYGPGKYGPGKWVLTHVTKNDLVACKAMRDIEVCGSPEFTFKTVEIKTKAKPQRGSKNKPRPKTAEVVEHISPPWTVRSWTMVGSRSNSAELTCDLLSGATTNDKENPRLW